MTELVSQEYGERYVSEYTDMTLEEWIELGTALLQEATDKGAIKPRLHIESTTEPYEDYLGDPRVFVMGLREKDEREKAADEDYARTGGLAKRLGVSHYEAAVIERAQKSGKVTIND